MMDSLIDAVASAICERRNASDWPCNGLDFDVEMARVAIKTIQDAGVMLVPVFVQPAAKRLTVEDLTVGSVYRMRKGGLRRVDSFRPGCTTGVYWTRMDGPRAGRTGLMSARYFAEDVVEVVEVAA